MSGFVIRPRTGKFPDDATQGLYCAQETVVLRRGDFCHRAGNAVKPELGRVERAILTMTWRFTGLAPRPPLGTHAAADLRRRQAPSSAAAAASGSAELRTGPGHATISPQSSECGHDARLTSRDRTRRHEETPGKGGTPSSQRDNWVTKHGQTRKTAVRRDLGPASRGHERWRLVSQVPIGG